MHDSYIISCDWGTTNCRVYLVHTSTAQIEATVSSPLGVASVFDAWQNQKKQERVSFFQSTLTELLNKLKTQTGLPLEGLPILISGMASSSIGLKELDYAPLPIDLKTPNFQYQTFPSSTSFNHTTHLISGVEKRGDVMRGEEMQVFGWYHTSVEKVPERCMLILPGTHSKHVYIQDSQIIDFNTYMTGEWYSLFKNHSILQHSLKVEESSESLPWDEASFRKGVIDSLSGTLSNLLFKIRAYTLQNEITPEVAQYYLSGLLIGHELKQLPPKVPFVIAANDVFRKRYQVAMETLGHREEVIHLSEEITKTLAISGHLAWIKAHV